MIIHDLRNPLANITNSIAVLQDVLAENDESVSLDDLFNIAQRSGKRMQQLINSILDISRLETGQAILETQPTALIPLLHDAVEFVTPQAEISEIQLITNLAPDLPQIEIDRDMISRVVLNLLDNAIKFTQVGGTVTLTAQALDMAVEIIVADNGPGIPTDQLKSIFEKFVRVHRRTGPKGTGLGLAFCHLAVRAHKGHIWAESELGQGATFHCILPVDPSISITFPQTSL
jgi:signal transduction histidine kinase